MAENTIRDIYQRIKKYVTNANVEIGLGEHPTAKKIKKREKEYARYEKELGLPPSAQKKLKAR